MEKGEVVTCSNCLADELDSMSEAFKEGGQWYCFYCHKAYLEGKEAVLAAWGESLEKRGRLRMERGKDNG